MKGLGGMTEPKTFASLSPTLLARKGGARPAMRSQLQPLHQFQDSLARQVEDDLGWNDMGHDHDQPEQTPAAAEPAAAEIVPIIADTPVAPASKPAVLHQQEAIAERIGAVRMEHVEPVRRSALAAGRRAAFTLRVDAERHLKLRLACTIRNRSAQQLVTEALDRLLDELPDISAFAAQVAKQR